MNSEEQTTPNPDEPLTELNDDGAENDPVRAIEQERDEFKDRYTRSIAEQENARKRHQRELQDSRKYAVSELAKEILDVLDNLQRALDGVPEERRDDPIYQGVRLVEDQLMKSLANHGVTPIEAHSQSFDPMLHNAVMQDERDDVEPGTVTAELARGYMLGDRLLRAAVVKVAAEKNTQGSPANETKDDEAPSGTDGGTPEG